MLESATRLFSAKGFDGVSVDDIVAAAGVNKRMVYHYYENKEGLYLAVLGEVFRRLSDLELETLDSATDPVEAIVGILEAYFAFLGKNPEFFALLSWENLYQGRFANKQPELLSKNPALTRLQWVRPWHVLMSGSYAGHPELATAEKGREFLNACANGMAGFLVELSKEPWHENFPFPPQ